MTALVWFRRDLRLHDHPALRAALDSADAVVPVFCFDDGLLRGRHASGPRTQFLLECLADLDAGLRDRGSRLIYRHGPPHRELSALAQEVGADAVHVSADVGPFARRRQREVKAALGSGTAFHVHPGLFAVDRLDAIRTQGGDPYTVFTPFFRNWASQPRRDVGGVPRRVAPVPAHVEPGAAPTLGDLGLEQECEEPVPGGERGAGAAGPLPGRRRERL
jgi:deoxyribodipyrimidine photo-lyase